MPGAQFRYANLSGKSSVRQVEWYEGSNSKHLKLWFNPGLGTGAFYYSYEVFQYSRNPITEAQYQIMKSLMYAGIGLNTWIKHNNPAYWSTSYS